MANNIKQVMDIRPGKGMTTGQSDEHQRNWTERGWEWASKHGNYDRTRERLNFEVIKGGKVVPVDKSKSIPDRMVETLRERSIKDPNAGLTEPKFRTVANIQGEDARDSLWRPESKPHAWSRQLTYPAQQGYRTLGAGRVQVCV